MVKGKLTRAFGNHLSSVSEVILCLSLGTHDHIIYQSPQFPAQPRQREDLEIEVHSLSPRDSSPLWWQSLSGLL